MNKYSVEFKLKVINYYKEGYGFRITAKHFNIPSTTSVRMWVEKYDAHGFEGLVKKTKTSYSSEFKKNVVEYMHTNHLSYTATAIQFNLGRDTIGKWEDIYYKKGPQKRFLKQCGEQKNMSSKSKKKVTNKDEEDLMNEVQRLRMENEYLKKLNALVQERIKRENERK